MQEREERYILEQVEQGASVDGLYPMNTEWRARYDARTVDDDSAPSETKAPE